MATTIANPQDQLQQEIQQETGGAPIVPEVPEPQPPTYGVNNRDLPESLKNALKAIVTDFQGRDLYDRRIEVLTDRILRFYDDGVQHIYPNYGTGVYQVGVSGGYIETDSGNVECPEYMGAYNIFRARRRTIDAVLTQNPPGIDFRPDHPDRDEDLQAAETAEGYRHLFDQANDVPELQQNIARFFELSGRCVTWTHTTANQEKWGVNEQGEPRQMEVAEAFGTLETKVPIVCKCQALAPYVFIYKDKDVLMLRKENPWLRDDANQKWEIVGGEASPGESDWERFARLGVKQARKGYYLTGSALAHITTEMHAFIRPAAWESDHCLESFADEQSDETGEVGTVGDKLKELFPEGCHVVYIGKAYSEATAESMDDHIDIGFPVERDGMTGGALMEPMKVAQDGFNDLKNAELEAYEKGWPMLWFRGDQEDFDAMQNQQARPFQKNLVKNAAGPQDEPLGNNFYMEPPMDLSPSFVQCYMDYQGNLSQDLTGALPALAGQANPDQKTASGQAMLRAQAMGTLGPAWANLQRMFSGIYKKAALCASENPDHAKDITVVNGAGQSIEIHLERLKRGSFHAHPDVDSTFPESTAAKRATMTQLLPMLAASPVGLEFMKSPDNWEEVLDLNGFPELTLSPALAYKKQVREFELLLREAPTPNQAAVQQYQVEHATQAITAQMQGMPAPPYTPPMEMLPSIIPGEFDYHQWEFAKVQEYLSSEDCWRQIVEGNQAGIDNITLHGKMHQQMMQAEQMAQAAAMAPPPMPQAKPQGAAPEANQQVKNGSQPPGAPNQPTI